MFAPRHQKVADELLRVCRPGGVIGMINFTPEGAGGDFFRMLAPYLPPPPADALPPLLWGSDEHVSKLFGDRVESLELTRSEYVEGAASGGDYHELFKGSFGPMVAVYADAGQPAGGCGETGARVSSICQPMESRRFRIENRDSVPILARRRTQIARILARNSKQRRSYSDRIATIGGTVVARRAAGMPARSATETAITEAPA